MQQERNIQCGTSFSNGVVVEDGSGVVNAVEGQRQFGRCRGNNNYNARRGR